MENLLEPEDIEWKYVTHITMTTQSLNLFRDERFKILCDCWNERNNFDDPNNEITWVKKIVPIVSLKPR